MNNNIWKRYNFINKNIITKVLKLETENKIRDAKILIRQLRKAFAVRPEIKRNMLNSYLKGNTTHKNIMFILNKMGQKYPLTPNRNKVKKSKAINIPKKIKKI